jgi:hypothetical protein
VPLIYIDESGDHAQSVANPEYPVFVVLACVFKPECYTRRFVPALLEFKFRHWNHESVVLHEREIRKSTGDFAFLYDRSRRQAFLSELSGIIKRSEAELVAVVWDKRRCVQVRSYADCLVRLLVAIEQRADNDGCPLVAVIESRGRKEDGEIRRAVVESGVGLAWHLHFVSKSRNVAGLQLADLCARPIGLKVLNPDRQNRAFDEMIRLLLRHGDGGESGRLIILS